MREQLLMKSWILLACALCTGCVDELELEDVEATEQNLTSVVTPAGTGQHMSTPAGTKVVVDPGNKLHAVYEDAGRIKYMTSSDGVSWTNPAIIGEMQAFTPTIAVAANGTIGVAYRRGSQIRYMWKPTNAAWNSSFMITSDGHEPSLVALGNIMHLAWSGGPVVRYARFAANSTALPTPAEMVHPYELLIGVEFERTHPTIAVSQRSAIDTSPVVRVAYLENIYDTGEGVYFALVVSERPASGGTWTDAYRQEFWGTVELDGASLSHTAIPTTGDFYVAASSAPNGTQLHYDNAWNAAPFKHVNLLSDRSVVDVTAQIVDCVPRFRYAISDINQGADGYGPTSYRTGRWIGGAAAPTWTDLNPIQISPSGTNAEALFFRRSSGNSTRFVPAVYEQLVGNVSTIVEETTTIPVATKLVPCNLGTGPAS